MKKKILTKPFGHISIGDKHYVVDVAMDDEARYKGLSKRHKLDDGYGMLFDMPKEDHHAFQMKDTYVPLDMVFIGKYGQIVDYLPNVQPLTSGPYKPKEKCKFVLEVPGNDLKDPQTNARVMADILNGSGLSAWGAYNDRRYLQYMSEARRAYAQLKRSGGL